MMRRLLPLLIIFGLFAGWSGLAVADGWLDWWMTADQQGQRSYTQQRYAEAAEQFEDPARKGAALYRAGDFEGAAAVFGRIRTAQAAYNRGNSVLLLGRYDDAIQSYEQALEMQPGWPEAEQNLAIAIARKERLAPPDSDAGGTGGMLGADEIKFDDTGRVNKGGTSAESEEGKEMSDSEMRAVWLRRVQNDPADFLRARFSYQQFRDEEETAHAENPD